MKPCKHESVVDGCRICFLATTDVKYAKLWDIAHPSDTDDSVPYPIAPKKNRMALCVHLGDETLGVDRNRLGLPHRLNWRKCERGYGIEGNVCPCRQCRGCPDYQIDGEPAEEWIRHLCYFVLPVARNGIWQERIDAIKQRSRLFNGRKLVAVVSGGKWSGGPLDTLETVVNYLGPGYEIIPVANDSNLREVAAWIPFFERLQRNNGPRDVCLFAHAKGVSKPVNPGVTCHEWVRIMEETCMDYWPLVVDHLRRYPITGSFKKLGRGFNGSKSEWHYSGTWYWLRLHDFFARNWRDVDRVWWGTESTPGVMFKTSEAGCLFHEAPVPKMNLYLYKYFNGTVIPAYAKWREENAKSQFIGAMV